MCSVARIVEEGRKGRDRDEAAERRGTGGSSSRWFVQLALKMVQTGARSISASPVDKLRKEGYRSPLEKSEKVHLSCLERNTTKYL